MWVCTTAARSQGLTKRRQEEFVWAAYLKQVEGNGFARRCRTALERACRLGVLGVGGLDESTDGCRSSDQEGIAAAGLSNHSDLRCGRDSAAIRGAEGREGRSLESEGGVACQCRDRQILGGHICLKASKLLVCLNVTTLSVIKTEQFLNFKLGFWQSRFLQRSKEVAVSAET